MFLVADFNTCENFAKGSQQLIFERVIKLSSAFGKSVEERIEDRLGKSIEVFFEEGVVLFLFRNRQKQSDIVLGYPFLQLRFRILILSLVKELAYGKPKTIAD